ncbi:MAG: proline--tRNA ligase [Planctomycetaceae bacterium]|nr:proline--tRNA ligase [Planctomycetaceae bacterium]
MRWSNSMIPTLREVPSEAVVPSHQLMLRAGLIQQVAAGTYSYLPLGWRVMQKVMDIIREEMNAAEAVEVFMPAMQPIESLERSGRNVDYGDNLFVLTDRHGRAQALSPTHEEVITDMFGAFVKSYKQLPLTLYQIQTKFRDEFRPRFGVLRSREFMMKDAYSFHIDEGSLGAVYQRQYDAYCRIFDRCGVDNYVIVEAESGPIGGSASHEFIMPCETGEDVILQSDKGNYAANVEKCEIGERGHELAGEATGELEQVHTPGCATIEDVGKIMKVKAPHLLKTMVYEADGSWVVAVVRGDHELNEGKLKEATGASVLVMADEARAKEAGFAIGFVGPHVPVSCKTYVDPDAAQAQFWACGANEADHHVKHFNWQRDLLDHVDDDCVIVADIRNAAEGDPSPKNDGGVLRESRGIELGHVFKLGSKYSDALGVTVLDEQQQARPVLMGCYGIGVNRILAAWIESDHGRDEGGIIWPMAIAPYQVVITTIKYEGEVQAAADALYDELLAAGVDVLLDDRDERAGVKFKDADLIGIPLRITVGDRGLKSDEVELKARTSEDAEMVARGDAAARAVALIEEALKTS